jgi:hypothetical protein
MSPLSASAGSPASRKVSADYGGAIGSRVELHAKGQAARGQDRWETAKGISPATTLPSGPELRKTILFFLGVLCASAVKYSGF